jgi:acetyl esterase/lipase
MAVPALAVAGGFFVRLPVIGGFGRLLITDLPWLTIGAAVALLLALLALKLGGRGFTALLALAASAALAGVVFVGIQFFVLAATHGASYDLIRESGLAAATARRPDETLVFAEVDGEELVADVWRASAGPAANPLVIGTTPAVLYVHGGAFNHGSPGIRPHLFAMLAASGYTVFDIEYRLAPPPRWQDAPADVLCALGWFQREAARFAVDPARIVLMGDSAGGNLALVAAFAPGATNAGTAADLPAPSCDVVVAAPAGVIALYPTADLAATWADVRELSGETPFPETYVGGTPSQFPDRYEAASVNHLIRAGLPPSLVITGTNDLLVRVERMRDLAVALRAAGSLVDLIEVPFADHAFDGPANGFGFQLEETILPAFVRRVTR